MAKITSMGKLFQPNRFEIINTASMGSFAKWIDLRDNDARLIYRITCDSAEEYKKLLCWNSDEWLSNIDVIEKQLEN